MKYHRPWQPRIRYFPLFNPFLPITEHHPLIDRVEIDESEEEDTQPARSEDSDTSGVK